MHSAMFHFEIGWNAVALGVFGLHLVFLGLGVATIPRSPGGSEAQAQATRMLFALPRGRGCVGVRRRLPSGWRGGAHALAARQIRARRRARRTPGVGLVLASWPYGGVSPFCFSVGAPANDGGLGVKTRVSLSLSLALSLSRSRSLARSLVLACALRLGAGVTTTAKLSASFHGNIVNGPSMSGAEPDFQPPCPTRAQWLGRCPRCDWRCPIRPILPNATARSC